MAERSGELKDKLIGDSDENRDAEITVKTTENARLTDRPAEINLNSGNVSESEVSSDDPDQIRENIEETRAEMSETIDAIQEKLSFSNISEQVKAEVSDYVGETIQTAKNTVYEAVVEKGEFIMNYADKRINEIADTEVVKTAKRNPLALALIGLGLGMIYFSGGKKRTKNRYANNYDYDDDIDERNYGRRYSTKSNRSKFDAVQNKVSSAASGVGDTVSNAAGAVSDTVSNAVGTVSDTVSSTAGAVSGTVSDVASQAYKQAGKIGSKAEDLAETVYDQYDYYMEENPLAVGAVAMALGAAVGLAFPSTSVENRYMGVTRDNLLNKAEETARDAVGSAVGKVQEVAAQIKETVKEEVQK